MKSRDTDSQKLCYLLQQDVVTFRGISGLDTYRPTVVIKSNGWVGVYRFWLSKFLPFVLTRQFGKFKPSCCFGCVLQNSNTSWTDQLCSYTSELLKHSSNAKLLERANFHHQLPDSGSIAYLSPWLNDSRNADCKVRIFLWGFL